MVTAVQSAGAKRRTASKEVRRQQLIKATIRCISKRGLSETTMAEVAHEAGLSQGIINLHFQSKEKLLLETLRFIADDYKAAWERALEKAGPHAADRIKALVALDFSSRICERKKLAVWFAFWGEAKSRPTYARLCAERDRQYDNKMVSLCRELAEEGGYDLDAEAIARGLSAMMEGLWLDVLVGHEDLDRERAHQICLKLLGTAFPHHF